MTTFYNTTAYSLTPDQNTYDYTTDTLTTTDPSGGSYNYKWEAVLDLNTITNSATIYRPLDGTHTVTVTGEDAAWTSLHGALNGGNGIDTGLTTMGDGAEVSATTWFLFWTGLVSECINSNDKNGMSVVNSTLSSALNDSISTTSSGNDLLFAINYAFRNPWGTQSIDTYPDASSNYWAALLLFIYHTIGVSGLTGDPSSGNVSMNFNSGDGIGIRISCSIGGNSKTGLLKLTQS